MRIQISNLNYTAGESWVLLRDASLTIAPGEVVGVSGENGCGKTTLIQLIAGLIRPRSGRIMFARMNNDWVDATCWPLWKRSRWGIQYLPQENRIWPGKTVADHIRIAAENCSERVREDLVSSIYKQIPPSAKIEELSQGQQRFVLIMRSLMLRPRILVADEPFAGLDSSFQSQAKAVVQSMVADGMSAIIVEHDREAINGLGSRQFILKEGQLYAL